MKIKYIIKTMNKKIWIQIRDAIDSTAKEYDNKWRKRIKKGGIDSKFLINFIFQLTLNINKGYGVTLSELWSDFTSKNIKLLQSSPYSISSICEARQKLPEDIFLEINSKIVKVFNNQRKKLLMNKHRVYAIDGTKVSLDKNLEAKVLRLTLFGIICPILNAYYEKLFDIKYLASLELRHGSAQLNI